MLSDVFRDGWVHDDDVLEIMMATDYTYFAPGSDYRYSNSGYAVLVMMVEKYSGRTIPEFLQENIFAPLGMRKSVAYRQDQSTVPERTYGYSVDTNGVRNTDQSPWSAVLGDGGIYSSLDDLYRWDQALYTDKLVSADSLALAFTPNLESYGFGWRIDVVDSKKRYHHSGSTSGFRNYVERYPDDHLTVIVLSNRADPDVAPLAHKVTAIFLR